MKLYTEYYQADIYILKCHYICLHVIYIYKK